MKNKGLEHPHLTVATPVLSTESSESACDLDLTDRQIEPRNIESGAEIEQEFVGLFVNAFE